MSYLVNFRLEELLYLGLRTRDGISHEVMLRFTLSYAVLTNDCLTQCSSQCKTQPRNDIENPKKDEEQSLFFQTSKCLVRSLVVK